jgi:hypothetical protein
MTLHPLPGDELDTIERVGDYDPDDGYLSLECDELDGITLQDVLSDPNAPVPIEVNGRKFLAVRAWHAFLREKEAVAHHRARQVKARRADAELEGRINWAWASAYREATDHLVSQSRTPATTAAPDAA